MSATLDQSKVIAVVPEQQERIALRNAGRPDSTRMDGALARELAYRSSIPVVVEGRVGRIGGGYSIVLQVSNAADGRSILSLEDQASDAAALMPTLVRMSHRLRQGLGERAANLRAAQTLGDVMTPSFEAFKLYARARELNASGDTFDALPVVRQALAIDPDFASAWLMLGTIFGNLGEPDSAIMAFDRALRNPERLHQSQRLDVQARQQMFRGELQAAIATLGALLKLDPSPGETAAALNNTGICLSILGEEEQALEFFRRSGSAWPVQPPGIYWQNLSDSMVGLGRPADARVPLAHFTSEGVRRLALLEILLLERNRASADSLAKSLALDAAMPAQFRAAAGAVRASLAAERGELEVAERGLDQVQSAGADEDSPGMEASTWIIRATFAELRGRPVPPEPGPPAGNLRPMVVSLRDAMLGDSAGARRRLAAWQPAVGLQRRVKIGATGLLQGRADWRRQRWDRVVEELRSNAANGSRNEPPPLAALRTSSRWLIADAFEGLGQPDSARFYLEHILDPPGNNTISLVSRGFAEPFVRQRLVKLNLSLGRLGEARHQWDELAMACVHPDAPLAAALDESRSVLMAAEGMGAGARK